MHLVTPLSSENPVRPVALRPHLSDEFAFFRFDMSLYHKKYQFKERGNGTGERPKTRLCKMRLRCFY
jgi:hypothetical protein